MIGIKNKMLNQTSSSRRLTVRNPAHPISPASTPPASPGTNWDGSSPSEMALAAANTAMATAPPRTAAQIRASEDGLATLAPGLSLMIRRPFKIAFSDNTGRSLASAVQFGVEHRMVGARELAFCFGVVLRAGVLK